MEREALVETLLRLAPRARGQNYLRVDFVLAGELMEVSVKDERLKLGEVRERLAAEAKPESDEEFRISFNPAELLDGVEAADAPVSIMSTNEPLKPVQIAAATEGGEEPDFRYLLMPMRRPADVPGESGD